MDGVSSTGDAFCAGLIIVLSSILTESFLLRRTIGFVGFNFIEMERCMVGAGPRFAPELYCLVTRTEALVGCCFLRLSDIHLLYIIT